MKSRRGLPNASWPRVVEDNHLAPFRWATLWRGNGRERETEQLVCCGERGNWGSQGGEQQADVGGLLAIRGHGDFQAQATAQYHDWICSPIIAGAVLMCVAHVAPKGHTTAQGLDCHLCPCWCSRALLPFWPCRSGWLALPPKAILQLGSVLITGDPYYYWGPCEPCGLKESRL